MHARPEHQGDVLAHLIQAGLYRLFGDQILAGVGTELDQARLRVEAVPGELGGDGMTVGGERTRLDQDAGARAAGPIEAGHHEMQVRGERVHRDDFAGARSRQMGQAWREILVIRNPGPSRSLVPVHSQLRPILHFLQDELASGQRHQSQ